MPVGGERIGEVGNLFKQSRVIRVAGTEDRGDEVGMREGLCVLQILIFEGVEADVEFRGAGQNADGFALGGVEEAEGGF